MNCVGEFREERVSVRKGVISERAICVKVKRVFFLLFGPAGSVAEREPADIAAVTEPIPAP